MFQFDSEDESSDAVQIQGGDARTRRTRLSSSNGSSTEGSNGQTSTMKNWRGARDSTAPVAGGCWDDSDADWSATEDGDGDGDDDDEEGKDRPAELVQLGVRVNGRRDSTSIVGSGSAGNGVCPNGGQAMRGSPRQKTFSASNHNQHHRRPAFQDYYRMLDERLGAGAYGSVSSCRSLTTCEEYAVKVVSKHEEGHTRSRILREVKTFRVCHGQPNIVQLIEWFEDADSFYLVFEKMRGGPLLGHIQRKGYFTEHEAALVTRDLAHALKFLHDKGIAHRDVKPENILCSVPDRVSPVKLCDLDLASKVAHRSGGTLPDVASEPDLASPVGSAEFMAPEVVDAYVGDALRYDKRCDMWSLGVIIYIMLCGYPPFYGTCDRQGCGWDQGEPCDDCQAFLFSRIQTGEFCFPEEEWEDVSASAKDLIEHLLVREPTERYTADEVLRHDWLQTLNSPTAPTSAKPLRTPSTLGRNESARDMHLMSEHFNVMSRLVAVRLSARQQQQQEGGDYQAQGGGAGEEEPGLVLDFSGGGGGRLKSAEVSVADRLRQSFDAQQQQETQQLHQTPTKAPVQAQLSSATTVATATGTTNSSNSEDEDDEDELEHRRHTFEKALQTSCGTQDALARRDSTANVVVTVENVETHV